MPQSRIHDHFQPSNKYPPRNGHTTQRAPPQAYESDSEGSEGLEAIHLSAKKAKAVQREKEVPPIKVSLTQKRTQKRVVRDSDEEDEDEEEEEEEEPIPGPSSRRRRAESSSPRTLTGSGSRRKVIVDPDELSEPDSLDGFVKGKSGKRSSPQKTTPTPPSRPKRGSGRAKPDVDIVIDVPLLSRKERASYSPWSSPARPVKSPSNRKANVIVVFSSSDDDNTPITRDRLVSRSKTKSSPLVPKRKPQPSTSPTTQKRPPSGKPAPLGKSKFKSIPPKPTRKRVRTPLSDSDERPTPVKKTSGSVKKSPGAKKVKRDPDESHDEASTEEEEDMVAELELDQPERFESKTRLRPKGETQFQRTIRKNKEARLGIIEVSSGEEDEEEDEEQEDDDGVVADDESQNDDAISETNDFIVPDDEDALPVQLPHEFSHDSTQTPEFKFKVVFHYLLYLVMKGSNILPLRGEEAVYFEPYLRDVRRRMTQIRDSSVRSQIWKPELIHALQKYPNLHLTYMDGEKIYWCWACNRRLPSRLYVCVGGRPYHRDTHEERDDSAESSITEESSDSEVYTTKKALKEQDDRRAERRRQNLMVNRKNHPGDINLLMGYHCMARTKVYHQLCHWEETLYTQIQEEWFDLLRASGMPAAGDSGTSSQDDSSEDEKVRKARRSDREDRRVRAKTRAKEQRRLGKIPENPKDVEQVIDWMDKKKIQSKLFHAMEKLVEVAMELENDKSKDQEDD